MALVTGKSPYLLDTVMAEISEYRGDNKEISIPVHVSQLKRWIESSPTKTVAMRVENFSDPATVTADWVIIDTGNPPADKESANIYYAVIDSLTFIQLSRYPDYPVINARFARNTVDQSFYVFFNISRIQGEGGGGSGDPESSGVKVR